MENAPYWVFFYFYLSNNGFCGYGCECPNCINAALTGNKEIQIEGWLNQNWNRLRRRALQITGDRHRAEDMAQEAILIVMESLRAGKIRDLSAIEGYMHTAGKRQSYNEIRKRNTLRDLARGPDTRDPSLPPNLIATPDANTEKLFDDYLSFRDSHMLIKNINLLSQLRDRALMRAVYLAGLSPGEACSQESVPPHLCNRVLFRARKRLIKLIQETDQDTDDEL